MTSPARTEYIATEADDGRRLDQVLATLADQSRAQATARIAAGDVEVDGVRRPKSHLVHVGARISVAPEVIVSTDVDHGPVPPIRYEDEHVLVLAKPAGLVVHPGVGHVTGTLVQRLVQGGYTLAAGSAEDRPGLVHRLDRDTSGLMVVAKSDIAYEALVDALRRRDVDRRYLAIVEGIPGATRGRVDAPIGRDPRDRKRFAAVSGGKQAITHWRVLDTGTAAEAGDHPVSLIECKLETGRTHQIRVHLTYAGHPVVGDRVYGARAAIADALGLDRPFLHAASLSFRHPVEDRVVSVQEPLPDELAAAATRAAVGAG